MPNTNGSMFFLCIKIVITVRSEADFADPSGKNKTKFEHFAKTSAPLILRRRVRLQSGFAAQKTNTKIKVSNFPKFPQYNQHVFQGNEKIRKSQDWSCIKNKRGFGSQRFIGHPKAVWPSRCFLIRGFSALHPQ